LCEGDFITLADLPEEIASGGGEAADRAVPAQVLNPLESAERQALLAELERQRWNVTVVARSLSTSRNTIYRKMKRLGIRPLSSERAGD